MTLAPESAPHSAAFGSLLDDTDVVLGAYKGVGWAVVIVLV